MSKQLYQRYVKDFKKRTAKIPWKYYTKILKKEYEAIQQKPAHSDGSKRTFVIEKKDKVFSVDEPHGSKDKPVGKWAHQKLHDLFTKNGLIDHEAE